VAPGSAEAHAALGTLHARANRVEPALKHLEEAVRLNPALADAHYELAGIWERRGDRSVAIMYLNQALRYGDHPAARRRLLELTGR